jgi:hypothetical protein
VNFVAKTRLRALCTPAGLELADKIEQAEALEAQAKGK